MISCNETDKSISERSIEEPNWLSELTFDDIGRLHNEGLEFMFNYYVEHGIATRGGGNNAISEQDAIIALERFAESKGCNYTLPNDDMPSGPGPSGPIQYKP